ncbi:MAG: carbohydrate-binding protein [Sedimentisphaerales bacterium]|nr:carbohydrate-binding protein [Sedimentisphaerales bacterium]
MKNVNIILTIIFIIIISFTYASQIRADYPVMSQHYAADPTAIEWDGRLYVYCSNDQENTENSGYIMDSIVCFSTDDLKNWTDHGIVFDADDVSWIGTAWAPCIVQNHNKLYLYFGDPYWGIGVVTSTSPTGPFTAPKNGLVVKRSTLSGGTSGADSTWLFDPGVLVDDNGQPYLFFGGGGSNQARYVLLDTNMYDAISSAYPINFPDFFEASHMHKYNGIYYYSYADNYDNNYNNPAPTPGSQIAYMTSSNPTGPFVYQGIALGPPPDNYGNNNHHTFFTFLGQWYCVYHNRYQAGIDGVSTTEHRNICLDRMEYNPDGTIQPVVPTIDGLTQLKCLDPCIRVEAETIAQQSGIKTETCSEGGMNVTSIENGDWIRLRGVDFGTDANSFGARVASTHFSGSIELRLDSLNGTVIGTCFVPNTGDAQTWTTAYCSIYEASGIHDLYLKFKGDQDKNLFNINWWQFDIKYDDDVIIETLPDPIHLYSFNEQGGNRIYDSFGSADGWVINGGVLNNGILNLSKSLSQYVDLPDGLVSSLTDCTIAAWIKLNSVDNWVRIFDFGSGTGVNMFLTPTYWGNALRFGIKNDGTEQNINSTQGPLTTGLWTHVAVTLQGNTGALYVNGVKAGQSNSITWNPGDLGDTTQNWLGRSQWNDPYLDGQFDEFRIYDVAFSANEAAWLFEGGEPREFVSGTTVEKVEINASETHQTIEGLGGAICFYNGWFTAHPCKQEIFDYAFSGLNLSMLRIGNWWRGVNGQDTAIYEIAEAANQRLGHPVPILISSWSPPAYLKSNGEVGNGGTLIKKDGVYDYTGFADYWYDSIQDYIAHGITPAWIGIQNEPDWTAPYDSCRFNPSEAQWDGQNYASFALALDAVHQKLEDGMASPPKLLGPENVGVGYNCLQDFMAEMNTDSFYGIAHHLYNGSIDSSPDGYNMAFNDVLNTTKNLFPGKPRFMTEYGDIDGLIPCANLIHNSLVVEQVSGYNHWSLIWPKNRNDPNDNPSNGNTSLVEIEFPWDSSDWISPKGYWINPSYWSMKHYSYFIEPEYKRVTTQSSNYDLMTSAFISPDHNRLVTVIINRSTESPAIVTLDVNSFDYDYSRIYQSMGDNHFESLGNLHNLQVTVPVSSITTIVLDKEVEVGQAGNPTPADCETGQPKNVTLTWTPGTSATSHAIYLGTDCNAVATATPESPEYQGTVPTSSFMPESLSSSTTYYWSVDEIAYSSICPGQVWSFSTAPAVLHAHLKFDEKRGTGVSDSTGNGWNGTLVNGGLWTSGKSGNAADLDGSNDYVSLPAGVVDGLTNYTISSWVHLDTVSTWSRVFDFGSGTTKSMYLTPQCGGSNTVRFAITTGGSSGEQQINGTAAIPSGVWTHVAVTYQAGTGILYIDGIEVGRNNNISLTPSSLGRTMQNYIGKSQWPDPYLNGRVDDFRIYSDVLSASEVAALAK